MVVTEVVAAALVAVVAVGMLNVVIVVVVVVVVAVVEEDVVVDLAQEAKTSDITMRKVSTIQITLFFKFHSFIFIYYSGKLTITLIILLKTQP